MAKKKTGPGDVAQLILELTTETLGLSQAKVDRAKVAEVLSQSAIMIGGLLIQNQLKNQKRIADLMLAIGGETGFCPSCGRQVWKVTSHRAGHQWLIFTLDGDNHTKCKQKPRP